MAENKEIHFIDILAVLVKYRKLIIINFLIVAIVAVIICLLLPEWFKAEAVIMPPEKEGLGFGIGMAGNLAGMMLGGGGGFDLPMFATPSDIYEMILKSKGVADSIIHRFNLMELYKQKTIEETRLLLEGHTFLEVGKEGAIFIGFEAKEDPELAADVVMTYLNELDQVNRRLRISSASRTRKFVEKRLRGTEADLKAAEDSLMAFQIRHNAIAIEEQVVAAITSAGQLDAHKRFLKIQLETLKMTHSETHPDVITLQTQINAINRQLMQMKSGKYRDKADDSGLFPAMKDAPKLGLEYARRLRNVKIQEILYELLKQQYEKEKLNEARNTATINILDKAIPPTKKSRPKRAIIVVIAGLTSIFFSMLYIFVKVFLENMQENDPHGFSKLKMIRADLKIFGKR